MASTARQPWLHCICDRRYVRILCSSRCASSNHSSTDIQKFSMEDPEEPFIVKSNESGVSSHPRNQCSPVYIPAASVSHCHLAKRSVPCGGILQGYRDLPHGHGRATCSVCAFTRRKGEDTEDKTVGNQRKIQAQSCRSYSLPLTTVSRGPTWKVASAFGRIRFLRPIRTQQRHSQFVLKRKQRSTRAWNLCSRKALMLMMPASSTLLMQTSTKAWPMMAREMTMATTVMKMTASLAVKWVCQQSFLVDVIAELNHSSLQSTLLARNHRFSLVPLR